MDDIMICETCNAKMRHIRKDSVQGWSCPNCGWSLLTTWIEEIYQDRTKYSIRINPSSEVTPGQIRLTARIAGVNYIASKKLLTGGGICVEKAGAPEIKKSAEQLRAAGIPFEIK